MRADAMLAKFQERGGAVVWKQFDREAAVALFTVKDGQPVEISFTIEDAKLAQYVPAKPGSAWVKTPDANLRARLISKAIRMLDPGVVAGTYTPEEIADFEPELKPVRGAVVENPPAAHLFETTTATPPVTSESARKPGRPRKAAAPAASTATPPAAAPVADEPFDAAPPAAVPGNPKVRSVLALVSAVKEVAINNVKTATVMTPERVLAYLRGKNICAKDKGLDSVTDLILDRILAKPDAFFRDVHTTIPQS